MSRMSAAAGATSTASGGSSHSTGDTTHAIVRLRLAVRDRRQSRFVASTTISQHTKAAVGEVHAMTESAAAVTKVRFEA